MKEKVNLTRKERTMRDRKKERIKKDEERKTEIKRDKEIKPYHPTRMFNER
jgi:hypothetical protein